MKPLVPGALACLGLSLAAACDTTCTDNVVPAIELAIEDESGKSPEAYVIESSRDGERLLDVECGSQSACEFSSVGHDPGVYDIRIVAEGYEDYVAQIVVDATGDGCHPDTVEHTAILTPIPGG